MYCVFMLVISVLAALLAYFNFKYKINVSGILCSVASIIALFSAINYLVKIL